MNLEQYSVLAYNFVWPFAERYSKHFEFLRHDMRKADLRITVVAYLSAAIFSAFLAFAAIFPLSVLALFFLGALNYINLILAMLSSTILAALVFAGFPLYAKYVGDERKRSIEINLPYAVNHMATIAASGAPPIALFRSLARFGKYGEISKEAEAIARECDTFGYDITDAVLRESERTPEKKLQDLLIGMNSTIRAGGDLQAFLANEANALIRDHRQRWKMVVEQMGMLSEVYATLFVAAPVFFIVMGSVMGIVGSAGIDPMAIIKIGIYLGIPAANIAWLLFLEMSVPKME